MRVLDLADGFTSSAPPTSGPVAATGLAVYADDASFVTGKGSAASNGDEYYNSTDNVVRIYRNGAWEYLLQTGVTGTRASAQAIVAGTGVAFTGKRAFQVWFIKGSGGAVTVSANPQIAAGQYVGQMLRLVGTDDTNTVKFANGTGLSILTTDVILGDGNVLDLMWDGTNFMEIARS